MANFFQQTGKILLSLIIIIAIVTIIIIICFEKHKYTTLGLAKGETKYCKVTTIVDVNHKEYSRNINGIFSISRTYNNKLKAGIIFSVNNNRYTLQGSNLSWQAQLTEKGYTVIVHNKEHTGKDMFTIFANACSSRKGYE